MFVFDKPQETLLFQKGEGYFKLLMFDEATCMFRQLLQLHPEHMMARLYLSLGLIELDQHSDAYRQLQLIASLSDDCKQKAIAYHAMGCIQVNRHHFEKALDYFKLAQQTDPTLSYYSLS